MNLREIKTNIKEKIKWHITREGYTASDFHIDDVEEKICFENTPAPLFCKTEAESKRADAILEYYNDLIRRPSIEKLCKKYDRDF